jgi:hypothetical protein
MCATSIEAWRVRRADAWALTSRKNAHIDSIKEIAEL